MNNNHIYLDYAATTPVSKRVFDAMQKYFSQQYGNPSSLHYYGREAQNAVDQSREEISKMLNCSYKEILFTASATESINTIINSAIHNTEHNPHIITTEIEHSAVLKTCDNANAKIDYISPNKDGFIDPEKIKQLLRKETALVSIGYANNEIGTIQPIRKIADIIKKS